MSVESNNPVNNLGTRLILGALGILFVYLRLTGVIDWSWWLVLLPFYAGLAIALGFAVLVGVPMGIVVVASAIGDVRRERARIARNDARRAR